MNILFNLSTLALPSRVGGACQTVGLEFGEGAVDGAIHFLTQRFTDHSLRLVKALEQSNDRAWRAFEIALAGDSFWERCKQALVPTEDKAFREQVRAFLEV